MGTGRITREGTGRGVPDGSDSVWVGLRHCDARGRDYVKRSHAGAPPGKSVFRGGARKPPGLRLPARRGPALAPPLLGRGRVRASRDNR